MKDLPDSLRPPSRDAHQLHETAPEADECPCPDCTPSAPHEENFNVND